ncbi:MAG TPA: hypothetical protein DCF87_08520, partial [Opitutae bacterium]|nr:hypothetical protein [Opitutae bacterium]
MRSEGISRVFIQDETLGILEDLLSPNSFIDKPVPENKVSRDRTNVPEPLRLEEPASSQVSSPKDIEIETKSLPPPPDFELPEGTKKSRWEWLQKKVLDCDTCNAELNPNGKVVFGEGDLNADLFLCGEVPGAEEEEVGSPFIGPAGELLMKILSA